MTDVLRKKDLDFAEAKNVSLDIQTWNTSTSVVKLRGFTKQGLINLDHTPLTNRSKLSTKHQISGLPIAFKVLEQGGNAVRGMLYVRVVLRMGGMAVQTLCEGYISQNTDLSYERGGMATFEDSLSGRGVFKVITGTNPAANVEISETVPTNAIWKVHSMVFDLVTDSNAAGRRVHIRITDGTNVLMDIPFSTDQTASLTRKYTAYITSHIADSNDDDDINLGLPKDQLYPAGFKITTATDVRQVGDDFGAPFLLVEEWLQD